MLAGALLTLGVLAAGSIIGSEVPPLVAWPSALASIAFGIRLARRELSRPSRTLTIPAGDASATLDDVPMTDFEVRWRGPLAFLQWRDQRGLCHRMQSWPDTLTARVRRELRLAMIARSTALPARSMAP